MQTSLEWMQSAAEKNQCGYFAYSQRIAINKNTSGNVNGRCFGIALAWLHKMAKKDDAEEYLKTTGGHQASSSNEASSSNAASSSTPNPGNIRVDVDRASYALAERLHRLQAGFLTYGEDYQSDFKQETGLQRAMPASSSDETQSKGKSRSFDIQDEMRDFAKWINGARSTRYFIVNTSNHTMAACGSRHGELYFFDPNSGIIHSPVAKKLGEALTLYFSWPKLRDSYKLATGSGLTVYKYVRASS